MAGQSSRASADPLGIPGIGKAAASFLTSTRGWTSRHVPDGPTPLVYVMSLLSKLTGETVKSRHSADPAESAAADELQPLHVGSAQAPVEGSDQLFGIEVSEPGEKIIWDDAPA